MEELEAMYKDCQGSDDSNDGDDMDMDGYGHGYGHGMEIWTDMMEWTMTGRCHEGC